MKPHLEWRWWLLITVLVAIGTALRLVIYVQNGRTFHDFGPALLGVCATAGCAMVAWRKRSP